MEGWKHDVLSILGYREKKHKFLEGPMFGVEIKFW
jgi:hypothetical protein